MTAFEAYWQALRTRVLALHNTCRPLWRIRNMGG